MVVSIILPNRVSSGPFLKVVEPFHLGVRLPEEKCDYTILVSKRVIRSLNPDISNLPSDVNLNRVNFRFFVSNTLRVNWYSTQLFQENPWRQYDKVHNFSLHFFLGIQRLLWLLVQVKLRIKQVDLPLLVEAS